MPKAYYRPSVVTFATEKPVATITRPSDTTTYAAGDEVSNSTSAPTVMSFTVHQKNGGSGIINGVKITSSQSPALLGSFELWLFNTTLTPTNDNSAAVVTAAQVLTSVCVVELSYKYSGNGSAFYYSGDIGRKFVCATADTKLYGRLIVRNAYVPASAEVLTTTLYVDQDV